MLVCQSLALAAAPPRRTLPLETGPPRGCRTANRCVAGLPTQWPRRFAGSNLTACWLCCGPPRRLVAAACTSRASTASSSLERTAWRRSRRRGLEVVRSHWHCSLARPHRCIKHNHDATNSHSARTRKRCRAVHHDGTAAHGSYKCSARRSRRTTTSGARREDRKNPSLAHAPGGPLHGRLPEVQR